MPMRTSPPFAVFLLLCLSLLPVARAAAAEEWDWQSFTFKDDLWLALRQDGKKQFDLRIGAGGAISEMRDSTEDDQSLLSPTNKGEVTDRVIQWTAWSETVKHRVEKLPRSEWRYNITQGGTNANQISPTVQVRWDKAANVIDVYSVPQDQWKTEQQQHIRGNLSALTRYEGSASGALAIRRVVRIGEITLAGKPVPPGRMIFEAWTPFRHSEKTFDSLALSLDDQGRPKWWYEIGHNLPRYPKWPVQETKGYAVAFRAKDPEKHDAVAVVYGAAPLQINHQPAAEGDDFDLDSMGWNDGIAILPGLFLHDVPPGSVIDQTILLVPRHQLDAGMASLLASLAAEVPPPQLYPPGTKFEGELAKIVDQLNANVAAKGKRTEHLAKLAEGGTSE